MLDAYLQSSVITKVPYILEGSSRMQMGFFLSETAIKNDFRMDDSRVICMGRVFQTAVDFFKGIRSTHPTDLSIRRNQLLQRMYSIETHEKKRVSDVFSVQMPPY